MDSITTIVHFSMPNEHVDEFLATWTKIKEFMLTQPGALDGVMHRSVDDESPFQLINVARWKNAEALANALQASGAEFKARGSDLVHVMTAWVCTCSKIITSSRRDTKSFAQSLIDCRMNPFIVISKAPVSCRYLRLIEHAHNDNIGAFQSERATARQPEAILLETR